MENMKWAIRRHLGAVVKDHEFNAYITVPFLFQGPPRTRWGAGDVASASRLVSAYALQLSWRTFGRSNQSRPVSEMSAFLGLPEKEPYLHFHIIAAFPRERWCEFAEFSNEFWSKKGTEVGGSPLNTCVEYLYNAEILTRAYNTKQLEDGFTIENLVARGPIVLSN